MGSVGAKRPTLWLFVIAVILFAETRAFPGGSIIKGMQHKMTPISKMDFMSTDGKFDDSLAEECQSKLGDAALEYMMRKKMLIMGTSCDSDSLSDSSFCMCLPSVRESVCTKVDTQELITKLSSFKCPEVMSVAAKKKDNCIVKKLSDHLKSQAKVGTADFKSTWQQLKEYQDALMSHIPLNVTMGVNELVTFVSDTEPEAKCDSKLIQMVRNNTKNANDLPDDLLPFASQTQLRGKMQKATKDQRKNMFRKMRKFKETCQEVKMPSFMKNKPDLQELELRKPDVATVVGCDALNATGDWKIESEEDVADKMACNLYQPPETLKAACDKISTLDADVVAGLLESKPQICLLVEKCKGLSKPVPLNNLTVNCLSHEEMKQTMSEAKDLASIKSVTNKACQATGMKRKQMEAMAETLTDHLSEMKFEDTTAASCVLKFIPVQKLNSATFLSDVENKKSFCQMMATADQSVVKASQVRNMSEFCKQAGVPLQEQDELLRNLEPVAISQMAVDDLTPNPQMSHFICRLDTLQEMAGKLKGRFGDDFSQMDSVTVKGLLPALLGLDEPTECKSVYSQNYRDLLSALKRITEKCTGDIIDAAKARYEVIVNLCEEAAAQASASPSDRRKRSTGMGGLSYDCADMISGPNPVDLTSDYISKISCDVFTASSQCLTDLANVDGYSKDQLQAFGKKITTCNNQLDASLTSKLCVLLLGLPMSSFDKVNLTSQNNVQCAGSKTNTGIDSNKLSQLFAKYMEQNEIDKVENLKQENIAEMGIIFCGIPAADIGKFNLYSNTSGVIDAYPCYSQQQLEALAQKEVATFGDVQPSSLSRIFYVTAGLADDVISQFTGDYIQMIPDIVFSKMPEKKLQLLNNDALCALSAQQASNIPTDVISVLPSNIIDIITLIKNDQVPEACDGPLTGDDKNGSSTGDTNVGPEDVTPKNGDTNGGPEDVTPKNGDNEGDSSGGLPGTDGKDGTDGLPGSSMNGDTNGGPEVVTPKNGDNEGGPSAGLPGTDGKDGANGLPGSSMNGDTNGIPGVVTPKNGDNEGGPSAGLPDTDGKDGADGLPGSSMNGDTNGVPGVGMPKNGDHEGGPSAGLPGTDDKEGADGLPGSFMPGGTNKEDGSKIKMPRLDLGEIEEYKPPASSYDFRSHAEKLTNVTAETLASIDLKRVPTSSIKELDDQSILEVAKEICDTSDHDKKAFIKTKIKSMFSSLDADEKKSVMGCIPSEELKSVDINELLPMMQSGKFSKNSPQAQLMAEKATDALKGSLSGSNGGPTVEEILKSAGSVICLLPTELFKKAVNQLKDKPGMLKSLMYNYTSYCGDRDPSRAKVLAETLGKTVDLKNKTVDELKTEMKTNSEATCSASDDLKNLVEDMDLLQTAMSSCNGTREELASRASSSYKNLQKYFTKIDTVSTEWQNKLRKLDWKNVDVSKGGILDYFIPLLRSDYENITKEKVCASEELPDVLGYPQVSLGAMMYQFCKDIYKTNFAKFKQIGIHAPSSEIKKNAKPQDVQNLKKAIYMVPKAKFDALCEVGNKDFNPADSASFSKVQYTLIGLDVAEMNKTKEEDRGMLCDMMACNAITALSPTDIEDKLTFCKKYLSWENFLCAHSPSIKEQFMIPASGLSKNTIKKLNISCQDVNDNLVGLAATVTSCDVRKWLYECGKENGRSFDDPADLEIFSQLVDQMPDEDFNKITDQKKCSMWEDVIREEGKRRTDLIDFRMNMNSLINHTTCYGVNNTITKGRIIAMKASCAKLNRRKRETSGMTCSEFLSYGNNREYLVSADDISGMSLDEFKDCTVDIGTTTGFNTSHWEAAATLAKQVYGDVSTWTNETLKNLGGITSGLSVDDLKKLNMSDLEAASVVGTSGTWDNDKLTTAYEEFKKDLLDNDAKNTNSTHLASIGELNCGATNEDIQKINPKAYCDAADKIGSLQNCEPIQKQAYATLAKDPACFGDDVASWSPDIIRVLGVQIGGLDHDDISALSGDQLLEIDRLAMEQIPPNVINAFSLDQLQMFDPDQISVLTTEQMESLDPEKRVIVKQKTETTSDSDDDGNDAALIEASLMLLLTMLMASLLRI